jgi:hypothetical protein
VANRTILRKACGDVIGIGCAVVARNVAAAAGHLRLREVATDMALRAVQPGMGTRQRESGGPRMIKVFLPSVPAMARFAFCRISQRLVIDGLCIVVIIDMA